MIDNKIINITLKNEADKLITLSSGTSVSKLLSFTTSNEEFIAAKVNNEITSLSYPLRVNSNVEFITKSDPLGMEVYQRSLCFLLEKVAKRIFSDRHLLIGHSLGPGYYFDLEGPQLQENEVKLIEEEMKKEVASNLPITRDKISYIEALNYFQEKGREDKYKLLSSLNFSQLSIYKCEDFFQVVDLPIVTNTGVLKVFNLIYYPPGFILQFPKRINPDIVAPFNEQRKIFEVYREYKEWGKVLKVNNVGSLNQIISSNDIQNFIQVAEALHSKKITHLADDIYTRKKDVKIVCIAGPSSSGKTTFSKRLAIQLRTLGLKPVTISVDNYFIDRDKTPLDEDGNPNYETIEAINLELFNEHLTKLLNGEKITLPVYNFFTGKSCIGDSCVSLGKDEIIVVEGIHCLNEKLTYSISKPNKYKIYISVLTQMNLDDNIRIRTTDNRLIRRLVRDYKYRGHSAIKTLKMWPSVRRGEEEYIFPYQNDADGYFNSALDFELALLRSYADPLLSQVKPFHEEYAEAVRLQKFLSYFLMIDSKYVSPSSIIREFIGGSVFHY